jgi:hypothetical protein
MILKSRGLILRHIVKPKAIAIRQRTVFGHALRIVIMVQFQHFGIYYNWKIKDPLHSIKDIKFMTPIKVGLISTGSDAEKKGFPLNTTLLGNSNAGHMYGTNLSDEKKWLLSEHMKTL